MTTAKYIDKLAPGPVPERLEQARITLRYSPQKAAKGNIQEAAETLQESFDDLVALAQRGFLQTRDLAAVVRTPAPDLIEVCLEARELPRDLVVIALRLVINANDNSPEDFQQLLSALDDDLDAALAIYGGVNFAEDVSRIAISAAGDGPPQPFDPFHLGGQQGAIRQARRLTLRGWGRYMPDETTEDLILRLSGTGAFLPVGAEAGYEPGDEEYFTIGEDLVIDQLYIETAALRAILSMLAPQADAHMIDEALRSGDAGA